MKADWSVAENVRSVSHWTEYLVIAEPPEAGSSHHSSSSLVERTAMKTPSGAKGALACGELSSAQSAGGLEDSPLEAEARKTRARSR
jgi:hypothetical protein